MDSRPSELERPTKIHLVQWGSSWVPYNPWQGWWAGMEGCRLLPSLQPEQAHFHLLILSRKGFSCFQFEIHSTKCTDGETEAREEQGLGVI